MLACSVSQSLLPDARIDFAHGQMSERELESGDVCVYQWRD